MIHINWVFYLLCINTFIKTSFHDMFNSLVEPNRTKSYKLERVPFKTLECFPSALFPKLWNSIELELKETKSAKSCKRKVAKISLDSYANYICKKITVPHVYKLSLCYLFHTVVYEHDSNNICYPLLQPSR